MGITKEYIDEAIKQAEGGQPPDLPEIQGFSSGRIRRLLNWLCRLEGANYLEIGSYLGSTLIPALWNNQATASCIDNWSAFYGRRSVFEANLAKWLPGREVNIIGSDMFTLDLDLLIPEVNVYFYDGPHSREGQYQAFSRYDPVFASRFVALVDDWTWTDLIREETRRVFAGLHYEIEAEWELPSRCPNDAETWWCGLFVAIVNKSR